VRATELVHEVGDDSVEISKKLKFNP
jgi:hypothetical protein